MLVVTLPQKNFAQHDAFPSLRLKNIRQWNVAAQNVAHG